MAKTSKQNLQSLLKLLQSNFSTFLLGLTVLLIVVLVASLFVKKNHQTAKSGKSWTAGLAEVFTQKKEPTETPKPKQELNTNTYQVKKGDSLWMIAEKTYGSGYNAFDIAQANNLSNPDVIEPGQNLVLPKVASKQPTVGEMTNQASQRPREYTVQRGEFLWKIAQRYYGNGYAWVKIAHANKLKNPSLIHAGNKLLLP